MFKLLCTIALFTYPLNKILYPLLYEHNHKRKPKKKHSNKMKYSDMELIRGDNGEYIWLDMRR